VNATVAVTVNGVAREVAARSVDDLVAALGLAGKRIAVERNGEIVPRSRYMQTPLVNGDRLEIVGAVGGG
jgi:sulfur carrier protein